MRHLSFRLCHRRINGRKQIHQDRRRIRRLKRANEQKSNLSAITASDIVSLATTDIEPIATAATRTFEAHDFHPARAIGTGMQAPKRRERTNTEARNKFRVFHAFLYPGAASPSAAAK
jgi:hypothetical protein